MRRSTPTLLPALVALAACGGGDEPREIDLIGSPGGGGSDEVGIWSPDVDTGSGSLEDEWAKAASFECGARSAESPSTGDDLLDVSWCLRMSPEGDELDGIISTDTGTGGPLSPAAAPPSACGFYNLVGAVDFAYTEPSGEGGAEDKTRISALYCDTDLPGGMRMARFEAGSTELESMLLNEQDCIADVDSGLELPHPKGTRLLWSSLDGLTTAVVAKDGRVVEEPRVLSGLERPWRLGLRSISADDTEEHAVLMVQDMSRELWWADVDFVAGTVTARQVLEQIETTAVVPVGEDTLVLACAGPGEPPVLSRVSASGALSWSQTLSEAACGWDSRPSLAVNDELAVLAWDDEELSHLQVLGLGDSAGPGADLERLDLPDSGRQPVVRWDGERFVVLDGAGVFRTYGADFSPQGSWIQPMLADRSGNLWGQRLVVGEDTWTVVQVAQDSLITDIGHLYTFYYVEATASPAP